jgi:hypothetical protein
VKDLKHIFFIDVIELAIHDESFKMSLGSKGDYLLHS